MGKFEPDWLKSAAPSHHPVDVGQRTEAIILAELVRRGLRVLMPFGVNHRYDFALDIGDQFLRVQCKTGRMDNGTVLFNAQSIRSNMKRVLCRSYAGEIDLFCVYCPENNQVYAVPVGEATSTTARLRVSPPANGQKRGIRWA